MRARILLPFLIGAMVLLVLGLRVLRQSEQRMPTVTAGVRNTNAGIPSVTSTDDSVAEFRNLVIDEYHSTNEHDSITSALARQLIAERLQTNNSFFEWATNVATAVIMQFVTNGNVPVYGSAGLTADALKFYKVIVRGAAGLEADATYDPDPSHEGPLDFRVQGGIHPTILMIQNGYRIASYQLFPEYWARAPRKIGRMNWSCAVAPLNKDQVSVMAQNAFHAMTGLNLKSFNLATEIDTEGVLNPTAVHRGVTVSGDIQAKLFTPKDYVYPFATFKYGSSGFIQVTFEGEMAQTSPGRGEFVKLFALVNKTDAIFELGEKFLGKGVWEQQMFDEVKSMDAEQRGQVYRRIFIR